jgi:hypothetical protein
VGAIGSVTKASEKAVVAVVMARLGEEEAILALGSWAAVATAKVSLVAAAVGAVMVVPAVVAAKVREEEVAVVVVVKVTEEEVTSAACTVEGAGGSTLRKHRTHGIHCTLHPRLQHAWRTMLRSWEVAG